MMFGSATKKDEAKKSYREKGTDERVNKTELDQSEFTNATQMHILPSARAGEDSSAVPQGTTQGEKSEIEQALDVVQEYNIVKQMLINNSLPIQEGNMSRKLIIDKKIIMNLLVDL